MSAKPAKANDIEAIRDKLRDAAAASGMSQQEIGVAMRFSPGGARQAVSRILRADSDYDPRLSTLLAFAEAVKRPLSDIL